jgi:hypothetical protein
MAASDVPAQKKKDIRRTNGLKTWNRDMKQK